SRAAVRSTSYSDCVRFIKALESAGRGPGTVAAARKVLRLVLRAAERGDAIRRNPATGLRVKRGQRDEMVFLAADEVEALASAIAAPRRGAERAPAYGLL